MDFIINVSLPLFLKGLGVTGGGQVTWEKLLDHFPSLEKLQKASPEDISKINGFAEKTGAQIVQGLKDKSTDIKKLLTNGVQPYLPKTSLKPEGKLKGKSFVLTGAMSLSRAEIKKIITSQGGVVAGAVSSSTTALVISDLNSTSTKAKKARELGVPLWSEEDLMNKIRKS